MAHNSYRAFLEKRKAARQLRSLTPTEILPESRASRGGKNLIDFGSNDYLGLCRHPKLIKASQDAAEKYGAGSTSSRLVVGDNPLYASIEAKLAKGKGTASALVMNSGYQANLTALAAFADADVIGKPVTILADRLCHNSLLQGALLSGARLTRFRHNDMGHLQSLLDQLREKDTHVIIVTESVFGMDGDRADLKNLIALKNKFGAMLHVDEAHATGLFGADGFGLASEHKGGIDIVMGTFGKALGSFGAYIATDATLRDYLINRCGGFIYSTALPPAVLGAIDAALDLLPQLDKERAYVQNQSARLRDALHKQGWDCGSGTTQIIPVILGGEENASSLAATLFENGIFAPSIRPPTVPMGTSRLRLSLSAALRASDIDALIGVMENAAPRFQEARAS